jgi:hypothetical protein
MNALQATARDLGVAARLGWRAARRRWSSPATIAEPDLRTSLASWLDTLPSGLVKRYSFFHLPADKAPWTDTGLTVSAGQHVTWFAGGRVYLSRPLDIWVAPPFQLWARVGATGPVFRGTRATHSFTAAQDGLLWLASYFPGEWRDAGGALTTDPAEYAKVSGGMNVCVVEWQPGVAPAAALSAHPQGAPDIVRAELRRLAEPAPVMPGWEYLWYLGPGEIYRPACRHDGAATIRCATHGDVGILRRDVSVPLESGVELSWSWRVDALPSDLREDSLPAHDYVSIAVEFDDGQDLTYYWSAALPVGTVYRCPLPTWRDKETHVVVRSGAADLGRWFDERRDVYSDYHDFVGGPARSVVRIWLIANSLFQRGHGRCEYAGIAVTDARGRCVTVL